VPSQIVLVLAAFVHHCVAHPLLFWSRDAGWAVWLHDASARVAFRSAPLLRPPNGRTVATE
jgi:hypothetical protein